MKNQQWLIDRAARERAAARPAGAPPPKYDPEHDGEGEPPLTVPGLLWADPFKHFGGARPPEPTPAPRDPRDVARDEHARALRDEALASIDPALVDAARAALAASKVAIAALATLEAEKAGLEADVTEQAALRLLVIGKQIERARRQLDQADRAVQPALAALRMQLTSYFDVHITMRERARARELDDQAELLAQQAADLRMAPITARGWLENYLPPVEAAPVEPAAKKRRKLFS